VTWGLEGDRGGKGGWLLDWLLGGVVGGLEALGGDRSLFRFVGGVARGLEGDGGGGLLG
jgi:hypothetical protein